MKVLLVNKFHYKRGGSETYYFGLAEALRNCGHEVIFFSMKDKKNFPCEQERYFVSNASLEGNIKSKLNLLSHLTYSKEAYRNMKRLLKDERPDLVILNLIHKQLTLSIIDAIKEFDSKLPLFWVMHDLTPVCPAYTMRDFQGNVCEKCLHGDFQNCVDNRCVKGSMLMSMLSKYEAELIRKKKWYDKIDLYICPSDFHRKKLIEGNFTQKPIVTLRNPLYGKNNYAISGEDKGYLLYLGRLSPEKGPGTLIEAVRNGEYHLVILGTGPQEKELQKKAKDLANVEFKGFQTGEALESYVKNCRCVVLPSECHENCPYSAMEAMSVGKPLIVSGYGGLPELVEDGVNGFIYGHGSEELAECISKMMTLSEESYQYMSRKSLEKAKSMFDVACYVDNLMQKYYEIKDSQGV